MKIDPWSSSQYQDYGKLRDEFGIEEFAEDDWFGLPHPHRLLRRGVIFGHRDFGRVKNAIQKREPWAVLTGLMPSGRMHLGHKMVLDEVIYYQRECGAQVNIAVADIEAYATRDMPLERTDELAVGEYLVNYIALGLSPERCRVYFQSRDSDVKDLAWKLGRKANWSEMKAIYGFGDSTNMAHVHAPLIQAGDILHPQLERYGGPKPVLVPVGVDQDPHMRLTRGIAQAFRLFNVTKTRDGKIGAFVKTDERVGELLDAAEGELKKLGFIDMKRIDDYKALYVNSASSFDLPAIDEALARIEPRFGGYGFIPPSSTYHRFMTALDGGKMSSSRPESGIFLTDEPAEAAKKVKRAKTGGATTLEEQRKNGGNPHGCSVYELFAYHLIEDDGELAGIYESCRDGTRMCGECKKLGGGLIEKFLEDLGEKREKAREMVGEFIEQNA